MLKRDRQRFVRTLSSQLKPGSGEPTADLEAELQKLPELIGDVDSLGSLLLRAVDLLQVPEGVDWLEYARQVQKEYEAPLREGAADVTGLLTVMMEARTARVLASDAVLKLTSLQAKCEGIESFSGVLQKATAIVASAALSIIAAEREQWENNISTTAKKKADAAHTHHRERKDKAKKIWMSKAWKSQAEAGRAIAAECHITSAVAGRWVREFKHS